MTIRFVVQRFALSMTLFICHVASSQAQETGPIDQSPPSRQDSPRLLEFLEQMTPTLPSDALASEMSGESRDPTAPSPRLLERVPRPAPMQPSLPVTETARRQPIAAVTPLPALPKISLRGLVLSTEVSGKAMLDVNGKSVTISLLPRDRQQRVSIPSKQFAAMKPALEQRAALIEAFDQGSETERRDMSYEMCLQCSFISDGVVFNLEGFTRDSLLLRAVPHDSILLVRKVR
ncbi:MAG: hypothetical protein AAF989_00685 [Planctomycetota bacterium]